MQDNSKHDLKKYIGKISPEDSDLILHAVTETREQSKKSFDEIKSYMHGGKRSVPDGISTVDYIRRLRED